MASGRNFCCSSNDLNKKSNFSCLTVREKDKNGIKRFVKVRGTQKVSLSSLKSSKTGLKSLKVKDVVRHLTLSADVCTGSLETLENKSVKKIKILKVFQSFSPQCNLILNETFKSNKLLRYITSYSFYRHLNDYLFRLVHYSSKSKHHFNRDYLFRLVHYSSKSRHHFNRSIKARTNNQVNQVEQVFTSLLHLLYLKLHPKLHPKPFDLKIRPIKQAFSVTKAPTQASCLKSQTYKNQTYETSLFGNVRKNTPRAKKTSLEIKPKKQDFQKSPLITTLCSKVAGISISQVRSSL